MISPPSFCGASLIFIARRIQPSLSLVDREVEFCKVVWSRVLLMAYSSILLEYVLDSTYS